jgi:hypothetical protein
VAQKKRIEKNVESPKRVTEIDNEIADMDLERVAGGASCAPCMTSCNEHYTR